MASSLSSFLSFLSPSPPPPAPLPPAARGPAILCMSNRRAAGGSGSASLAAAPGRPPSGELSAVMNPALARANALFFRGYNVQVTVDDNEPEERLLNRFRREVMRAGVIQECKRRRFFENKQDEAKRKTREAAKRNRRRPPNGVFAVLRCPSPSSRLHTILAFHSRRRRGPLRSSACPIAAPPGQLRFAGRGAGRPPSGELSAVMNPALARANALFFRGYNVQVTVDDNEPEERLLNRFGGGDEGRRDPGVQAAAVLREQAGRGEAQDARGREAQSQKTSPVKICASDQGRYLY
ncbi:hypothetical protein NL676_006289 [Syzygium grande]|nr:hypothetical protein NL676_006289 [Syzygium grande]